MRGGLTCNKKEMSSWVHEYAAKPSTEDDPKLKQQQQQQKGGGGDKSICNKDRFVMSLIKNAWKSLSFESHFSRLWKFLKISWN